MKNINKKLLITITISVLSLLLYSFKKNNGTDANPNILGSWVCEDDPNWIMVFDDSTCKWYYNGELQDDYTYQVNNSSPQCEKDVVVDSVTEYLSIVNAVDSSDKICYEIYGLTQNTLTLRVIDRGGFLIFHK